MNHLLIRDLDKTIKASADANRIRILSMLQEKKMCVCEIAFVLGIAQPSVSRHLKKLRSSGFIESENEGLWTNYYLCPKNPYARSFIKNLKSWGTGESVFAQDKKKANNADRDKLCCLPAPLKKRMILYG